MNRPIILFFCIAVIISSCSKKEDPEIPNQEELITRFVYELSPTGETAKNVKLVFEDADGEGGKDPKIESGILSKNTTYKGVITLFSPQGEITGEIRDEKDDHQFFFETDIEGIEFKDTDDLGLETQVKTSGTAKKGYIKIILKHKPDKSATTSKEEGVPQI